jgi:hypothetical protein
MDSINIPALTKFLEKNSIKDYTPEEIITKYNNSTNRQEFYDNIKITRDFKLSRLITNIFYDQDKDRNKKSISDINTILDSELNASHTSQSENEKLENEKSTSLLRINYEIKKLKENIVKLENEYNNIYNTLPSVIEKNKSDKIKREAQILNNEILKQNNEIIVKQREMVEKQRAKVKVDQVQVDPRFTH